MISFREALETALNRKIHQTASGSCDYVAIKTPRGVLVNLHNGCLPKLIRSDEQIDEQTGEVMQVRS